MTVEAEPGSRAVELLRLLLRARRFDEELLDVAANVPGQWHVSIGYEASAAAVGQVRRDADFVFTYFRNHAHLACLGSDLGGMFAEVFGRDWGLQRGRAGSFHLADPTVGVPHTSAMVSAGVPLGLGTAFARKWSGSDGVTFCFFGDGALNEGGMHESLNLAALWRLPVVLVCENNSAKFEQGAPQNAFQSSASLCALVSAHGVHAESVDGRFPAAVAGAVERLTRIVRQEPVPVFLEVSVPIWPGVASFLPRSTTGRTVVRDALGDSGDEWRDRDDPVLNHVRALLAAGVSIDSIEAVDAAVLDEVRTALETALSAPFAPPAAAVEDVYAQTS